MAQHNQQCRCLQVDFEAVPDLVAGRKVFLRHGQAYVSKTDVVSLVVGHFRYLLVMLCMMLFGALRRTEFTLAAIVYKKTPI